MSIYGKLNARIDELGFGFPKSFLGADKHLMKQVVGEHLYQWGIQA